MRYILQYTRLSSCSGAKSCLILCGIPVADCLITLMEYVYSDFDGMEARPLKARVELSLFAHNWKGERPRDLSSRVFRFQSCSGFCLCMCDVASGVTLDEP